MPSEIEAFFNRAGSYEILALLTKSRKYRQQLVQRVDCSTSAVDDRLGEAQRLGLVRRVPNTIPEVQYEIQPENIPEKYKREIGLVREAHRELDGKSQINRDDINRSTVPANHTNVAKGKSRINTRDSR